MTDQNCGASNRDGDPCQLPAGWGTTHVGSGRCKLHGGESTGAPTGEDHGQFEHGLFSDHLPERDRDAIEKIDDQTDAEKLDAVINWRLARLRRTVRARHGSNDAESLQTAIASLAESLGDDDTDIMPDQLRELTRLVDTANTTIQEEIDLVRKLIKDRNKIAEGEDVNVSWIEALEGGGGDA